MDPLLIIHGSIYWIGPLDMWINHSGKTAYTTDYEGFRAYLLTVITDPLRFLAGSRASPGHRSAASTVFLIAIPEQKSDSLSAGNTLKLLYFLYNIGFTVPPAGSQNTMAQEQKIKK